MYQKDAKGYPEISDLIEEIIKEDQTFFEDLPRWKSWSGDTPVKEQISGDFV